MGLRIGLIGCGDIGRRRAAAIGKLADSLRLVAVHDIEAERARAVAAKCGGSIDRDWRDLVRRKDLDAVIVSTPPSEHAPMCIEALQNGKHVLCEKPLARTAGECRQIIEAAEKNGRVLATGFNCRFFPSFQKAQRLLEAGVIGELDHIRSYTGYSARDHSHPWIHEAAVVGGGSLYDNGIHLIDLTRYFLGEVSEVMGFASNTVWRFEGCEDNGFVLLRSPTGKIASLQASWTEWKGYRFLIELYGTRGCIRASAFPMLTQIVWPKRDGHRPVRKFHLFPLSNIMEHLRSYQWVMEESLRRELQAWGITIGGGRTILASGYEGLRAVEIASAVSGQLGEGTPGQEKDSL